MIVWIPNGSISACSDCIHPSRPNFDAAYAVPNSKPIRPAVEEIVIFRPERCFRITGRTARVTFIGPTRLVEQLTFICSGNSSSKKPA